MNKVLFVCSGNVGRSQIAEAYYNNLTDSESAVSAGTDPLTPGKYPLLPKTVIDLMLEDGIDVSKQTVKYLNEEMVNKADKVIVLCQKKLCPQYLLSSTKVTFWAINDPYKASDEKFRIIRDQIKSKVMNLVRI